MPRYFFDLLDGKDWSTDDVGSEADNVEAARCMAKMELVEIAHDELPIGQHLDLFVRIGDEAGNVAGSAQLMMHCH